MRIARAKVMVVSVVTAVAVSAGVLAAGTGGAAAAVPAQSKPKVTVEVGDNFFEPDELEVTVGTKVTWVNKGKILHNVVPVKGDKWGTKALTKGKKYSYRFKKPGTYAYYCTFHGSPTGGQRGEVVVKKPELPDPAPSPTTAPAATG